MKILLGGIPLGCDNIGDEAIIQCVVEMLKKSLPGATLTVATHDAASALRLGVDVVPAYGFAGTGLEGFKAEAKRHDAYIWCGATGLSDYPHVALNLLEQAQKAGTATFIWAVGMDSDLNPVYFRVQGRKRKLLAKFGLVDWYEKQLKKRLSRRIKRILPRCKGVWLRDEQSAAMLASMGFTSARVAADTAILLNKPATFNRQPATVNRQPSTRSRLGLCISTQRQVADLNGVKHLIKAVREAGCEVLGIPMNPKTDRALLEDLGVTCIPGSQPADVAKAVSTCDAVLSSRLHLLIIAANANVPVLGIARGAKIANWLANFGRTPEGSVYDCDWNSVTDHVLCALKSRGDWDKVRNEAYDGLYTRLERSRAELAKALESLS